MYFGTTEDCYEGSFRGCEVVSGSIKRAGFVNSIVMPKMFYRLCHLSTIVLLSLSAVIAARYPSFGTIQTTKSAGVLNAVINNTFSPINLFDQHVMADLGNLIEELQANDTDVRVVVFSSGNKDFFFPHIDSNSLLPGYGTCSFSAAYKY